MSETSFASSFIESSSESGFVAVKALLYVGSRGSGLIFLTALA